MVNNCKLFVVFTQNEFLLNFKYLNEIINEKLNRPRGIAYYIASNASN